MKIKNVLNSSPNNKILDLSKFKAFADDQIILTLKLEVVLGRVENIVGKGENVAFPEVLKVGIVW